MNIIRKNYIACSKSANYDNDTRPVCVPNSCVQQEKNIFPLLNRKYVLIEMDAKYTPVYHLLSNQQLGKLYPALTSNK